MSYSCKVLVKILLSKDKTTPDLPSYHPEAEYQELSNEEMQEFDRLISQFDFTSLINGLVKNNEHSTLWNEFLTAAKLYLEEKKSTPPSIIEDYFFYHDIKNSFSSVIPKKQLDVNDGLDRWRINLFRWFIYKEENFHGKFHRWLKDEKMTALFSRLKPPQQKLILKHNDSLIQTLFNDPETVSPLLELIEKLTPDVQKEILTQKNSDGENALMLIVRRYPEAVPHLLERIKESKEIFMQKSVDGKNALMLAALYQPKTVPPLLEYIKQFTPAEQKEILAEKWGLLLKTTLTARAQLHVRFIQLQAQAGQYAPDTRRAFYAERLYTSIESLFKNESEWPKWTASKQEAKENFKDDPSMMKLIEGLDKELKQHQRLIRNKREYEQFAKHFNLQEKNLSMDGQYLYLTSTNQRPLLAEYFLGVKHELSEGRLPENQAKERIAMLYALIKTFSQEQVRQILEKNMAHLGEEEKKQLEKWLEGFDEEIIAHQMAELSNEKNELSPSAPPIEVSVSADEQLIMAEATKTAELDNPVLADATLVNDAVIAVGVLIDDQGQNEALTEDNMSPRDWEAQLRLAAQATIKKIAALPHEKQQEIITYLEKQPTRLRQWMDEIKKDPISQRYFLLVQLGAASTPSASARDYLYTQLKTLIEIEERTSAPEKQLQISQLWQDFIERCRMNVEKKEILPTRFAHGLWNKPANVLDELLKIQQHPQFNPKIINEKPAAQASAPIMANPVAKSSRNGNKALFLALQNNNTQEIKNILAENYPAHLEYQEGSHNILTLMFSKRHPALYDVMPSIKNLPQDKRQQILCFFTKKQYTLMEPRAYVNQKTNASVMGKQALYVLELERIVLSMKDNDPAKEKLKQLHTKLAEMPSIEGNSTLQKEWFYAIQETRKMPEVKQKRGLINWFKNALGFAKAENIKGYGIGLFKPSVDSLLDDMTNLPIQEQHLRQKK